MFLYSLFFTSYRQWWSLIKLINFKMTPSLSQSKSSSFLSCSWSFLVTLFLLAISNAKTKFISLQELSKMTNEMSGRQQTTSFMLYSVADIFLDFMKFFSDTFRMIWDPFTLKLTKTKQIRIIFLRNISENCTKQTKNETNTKRVVFRSVWTKLYSYIWKNSYTAVKEKQILSQMNLKYMRR